MCEAFSSTDESDVTFLVHDCLCLWLNQPQAYPMERNTIELTAHIMIIVDEITAIKLAGPVCITGVVGTITVRGDMSAFEGKNICMINCMYLIEGLIHKHI
jgi:hypothetical protein